MRPVASALLVYIEPTPYVLGLIRELVRTGRIPVEVWFLRENVSQAWHLGLPDGCRVVEPGTVRLIRMASQLMANGNVALVHLGGWGGDIRLSVLMFMAWWHRIPLFIESDTQRPVAAAWWRRAIKSLIYPVLFRAPAKFLPGGKRQAEYLKSYGVKDDRIQIAQMTVDVVAMTSFLQGFNECARLAWRANKGIPSDALLFLFVGRLEPHKGIAPLLEEFGRFVATHPSARLVMVGDGSVRALVDRQASSCTWLVALGRLQGEELHCAYCAADVLVVPSEFEPWGLVVNEGMAAGLPVIASNRVGCVDDLIAGRMTGLVYEYENPSGLYDALCMMSDSPDTRARLGRNARQLMTNWTLQAESERVMVAWNSAL